MQNLFLLDAINRNILLDYILPITGIVSFLYCVFFLYLKGSALKETKETVGIGEKIRLKLSSFILLILIVSIVFIAPSIFFYYRGFQNLETDKKTLNEQLVIMQGQIKNNQALIMQIQKCMMPISFKFPILAIDSLPSLDDLRCSVIYQGDEKIVYPMRAGGYNAYKILVSDINCNNLIKRIEVEDQKGHRVWFADDVEPCNYFVNPISLLQKQ
jgi:hypothetical protein